MRRARLGIAAIAALGMGAMLAPGQAVAPAGEGVTQGQAQRNDRSQAPSPIARTAQRLQATAGGFEALRIPYNTGAPWPWWRQLGKKTPTKYLVARRRA